MWRESANARLRDCVECELASVEDVTTELLLREFTTRYYEVTTRLLLLLLLKGDLRESVG